MAQRSSTIDLKVTTFQLDFWIYGCAGTRLHLDVCDQQCLWEWLHPVISTGFCGPNNISAVKLLQNWGPKLGISCYVLLNVMVFKFGNCVISWSNYPGNPGPDRKQNIWWASLQDPQVQLLSTGSHPICVNDVTILTIIFGNIYNILQWSVNMIYIYIWNILQCIYNHGYLVPILFKPMWQKPWLVNHHNARPWSTNPCMKNLKKPE
jgi:hypothetical protein